MIYPGAVRPHPGHVGDQGHVPAGHRPVGPARNTARPIRGGLIETRGHERLERPVRDGLIRRALPAAALEEQRQAEQQQQQQQPPPPPPAGHGVPEGLRA